MNKLNLTINKRATILLLIVFLFVLQVAVTLILHSCASTIHVSGRPIEQTFVDKIRDGETTTEQIIMWFGAPTTTSTLGDNILYIYKYCKAKSSIFYAEYFGQTKTEELCDELTITFDKEGKVKAHNFIKRIKE